MEYNFIRQWEEFYKIIVEGIPKSGRKDTKRFNKSLETKYPHIYKEEKNLIIKWNKKIERNLETNRIRKCIKFKNKSLTRRSNFNKGSNNLVTSNTEVETAPVDIVSRNED